MQLDTDEVTVENSMSKSFDQIIKLQLDPVWNQLVLILIWMLIFYVVSATEFMYRTWHKNNNIARTSPNF